MNTMNPTAAWLGQGYPCLIAVGSQREETMTDEAVADRVTNSDNVLRLSLR
jgi:hypothetical protein